MEGRWIHKKARFCLRQICPGWDQIPIADLLREEFGIPVFLKNDADACALAEWKLGAGKGAKNMAFFTFGTGMGAGLILNGELYTGACDMAGEIGHVRMANYGPVGYGKVGSVYVRSKELLLDTMWEVLQRECLPKSLECCQILPSGLGEKLGDVAALTVAAYGMDQEKKQGINL